MAIAHRFVWRTFTSVFLGASFLMAVLSGAILFLAPPGRIAAQYCTDEGISVEAAIQRLDTKGLKASKEQTLREIAVNNGLQRPSELLEVLREAPGIHR